MAKLIETRKYTRKIERRRSDPEFDAQIRKRAAERKRRERLRNKTGVRENELLPEAELNLRVVQDDFREKPERRDIKFDEGFPKENLEVSKTKSSL